MMDIQIGIAAHKEYKIPWDDIYLPIHVGATGKKSILAVRVSGRNGEGVVSAVEMPGDDSGDNISAQNPRYCELTGLYWIWKNLRVEYAGLVHYRRHFADPESGRGVRRRGRERQDVIFSRILGRNSLEKLLRQTDIVLPRRRDYYIESIYSHYAHSHYPEHLDVTRAIIGERCPEYLGAFDRLMKGRRAHMFNMMIMKKELLDAYCSWLFPILEELDRRIDSSTYDSFQARYPGRVSELLLDVWIEGNGYSYRELPVIMTEKVHWGRKVASFLGAKFLGRRYRRGF